MNIQDELGVTFVVVTHDQEEAMTLSTRIAVMEQGRFLQVGAPKEIYEYPESRFVADFIGSINMFEGIVTTVGGDSITVESSDSGIIMQALGRHDVQAGQSVCIAVRPEKMFISREAPQDDSDVRVKGVVDDFGYLGNLSLYRVRLESGKIILVSQQNRRRSAKRFVEWEEQIWISWRPRSSIVLVDED